MNCKELSYKICESIEEYLDYECNMNQVILREEESNDLNSVITYEHLITHNRQAIKKINNLIVELYNASPNENFVFFDAPFKIYENKHEAKLEEYLQSNQDANLKDFINDEVSYFNNPSDNRILKDKYNQDFYYDFTVNESKNFEITIKRKKEFLNNKTIIIQNNNFNKDIFRSKNAEDWFNLTLSNLDALSTNDKAINNFPAKVNAIFRNGDCKNHILKFNLGLKKFIEFLNEIYSLNQNYYDKLSDGQNYEIEVNTLIQSHLKH